MHVANLVRVRLSVALRMGLIAAAAALWLAAAPAPAADAPAKAENTATIKITQDPPSVRIEAHASDDADTKDGKDAKDADGKRGKRPRASISFDSDRDFEQFHDVKKTAPWFIGVMFLFVGALFLTPIILLIGIVWYKLRKARMQNEALLKLAERGVMPSAQVIDAVTSGIMPAAGASEPRDTAGAPASATMGGATAAGAAGIIAAASAYEQAVQSRRRAVWTDLRKGVLLSAVGLSIVVYSVTASGSPNWLGLAVLFVGVGYLALWWLEDRQLAQRADSDSSNRKG